MQRPFLPTGTPKQLIEQYLASDDPAPVSIIAALVQLGPASIIPALTALASETSRVVQLARMMFEREPTPPPTQSEINFFVNSVLSEDDPNVRGYGAGVLVMYVEEDTSLLPTIRAIAQNDPSVRVRNLAAYSLCSYEDREAIPFFERALRDTTFTNEVRHNVLMTLSEIAPAAAKETLRAIALDQSLDQSIRGSALLSFVRSKDPAAHEFVAAFLMDTHEPAGLRLGCISFYMSFAQARMPVETMIDLMRDPDPDIRFGMATALGTLKIGRAANAIFDVLQNDPDPNVRAGAAQALGDLKDRRGFDALVAMLDDPAARTRAIAGIRASRDLRGVEPLIAVMRTDDDPEVRAAAANALGDLKNDTSIEALIAALDDPDIRVLVNAANSLGRMGDARAIPKMEEVAQVNFEEIELAHVSAPTQTTKMTVSQIMHKCVDAIRQATRSAPSRLNPAMLRRIQQQAKGKGNLYRPGKD